jgi:hypothetical protein
LWSEVEQLVDSVRGMLADPQAGLNDNERRRWEGALIALEVVLGERDMPVIEE